MKANFCQLLISTFVLRYESGKNEVIIGCHLILYQKISINVLVKFLANFILKNKYNKKRDKHFLLRDQLLKSTLISVIKSAIIKGNGTYFLRAPFRLMWLLKRASWEKIFGHKKGSGQEGKMPTTNQNNNNSQTINTVHALLIVYFYIIDL